MMPKEVREEWIRFREDASKGLTAAKESQETVLALYRIYRSLTDKEKRIIDELLAEQLGSDDELVRFDALAVIQEFHLASASSALMKLNARLEGISGAGAASERIWVDRIISQIEALQR
jgi:hypothetical protein